MHELIAAPSLSSLVESTGSLLSVETEEGATSLHIEEVQPASSSQHGYESFSVLLTGPARERLQSGIYRVNHDTLGSFDLCMNPTWANHDASGTWEYQAVFNRAVEPEAEETAERSAAQQTSSRRGFFSRIAAAAAGGGIIAGLLGADSAEARPAPNTAGIMGSPLPAGEPLIGGIGMFAGTFPPRYWTFCDGQILPISQNTALFSILGTTYGGDGRTTFALPDLRGRVPIHEGQGPGLTPRSLGEEGGQESVALSTQEMPAHTHTSTLPVASTEGDATSPNGNVLGAQPNSRGTQPIYSTNSPEGAMNVNNAQVGGSQAHDNMPPFLAINYVIAITGRFPPRN